MTAQNWYLKAKQKTINAIQMFDNLWSYTINYLYGSWKVQGKVQGTENRQKKRKKKGTQ